MLGPSVPRGVSGANCEWRQDHVRNRTCMSTCTCSYLDSLANGRAVLTWGHSIIPTFWTLNDCNEAGLKLNPSAEALFLDSMLTARAFENTCGMAAYKSNSACIQANAHTKAIVFANTGGPPGRGYAGKLSMCEVHIRDITDFEHPGLQGYRKLPYPLQVP